MLLLFTQTPLQQLLKIPVLIEHYREHRADSKNISLLDYIQLHYFSSNPMDADYDRDMQLPFRANDVVLVYSVVVIPEDYIIELLPLVYKEMPYPLLGAAHLSPKHTHSIWQPPRVG